MEGLGAASSVIAVVDISIKVVTICSQYYKAVASARDDIQRLQNQLCGLQTTLNRAREVIESPENDSLSASPEFSSQLDGCWATLNELLSKLEPDETQSVMRKFGLRALKWPFSRKEMERTMSALEQYQRRMMDSLQIDQTNMLLKIQDKMEKISIRPEIELPVGQMPHFVLPFPRDADFISRPEIQSWIRDQYESTKYRAAIVGIGGIGKSQLAIDFAHEVHELYPERSVFWAYGMTKDTLEESYRAIAEELMIPGRNDPKAQILTLVRNWLQREDVAPWLLILDNADDMNTFFQVGSPSPLASYLPKTGNGRILITSRNMSVAERLTGSMKSIKRIPKMNEEEALLLLGNKLSSDFDNAIATRLLESLDYIPLAITQAAAYINRRKISLQKYLDRFKANEKQRTGLLSHDAGDIWRHETVSNSVIVTWQVTLEQILHERPSAADLLSLMSCFQPLGIPQQMLRNYRDDELDKNSKEDTGRSDDEEDDNTLVSSDVEDDRDEGGNTENEFDEALEDDLDVLLGYCLIQESEVTEEEYEMHPLVQLCTRVWLSKANNLSRWNDLFLKLASEMFPAGSYETWDVCNYLLPHIIPVLEKRPVDQPNLLNWARLLTNAAWYTAEMGDFEEADILIQRAVDTRKAILGLHDIHTLRSMAMLAVVYHERGHYEEAEKLQLQVAESANESLEESNDFRIASTSNLSLTYYEQDRFEEAAKLQTQVLESCRLHYGDEDTMTLTAMSNLALTYSSLGRDTESEHLERQALEIRKKTQGDEHPSTLNIMNNLAMRLMTKGEWEEAEKLQLHVLQFRTELVGETHPDTLVNMGNLASIYSGQGRLEEAEKLELRVIESKAELFGADHSFTLKSRANLVYTLENQGRTEEADKLHNEVFEIIKGKLGEEHPDTIDSLYSAGLRLYKRGWLDEAMRLVQEACSRRERVLGPDHKQTKEAKSVYESWQSKLQPSK